MIKTVSDFYRFIGKGYKVRAPRDGQQPEMVKLIPDPNAKNLSWIQDLSVPRVALDREILADLEEHQIVFALYETNHGKPNTRLGWRDMGLDGDVADWYVMMQ